MSSSDVSDKAVETSSYKSRSVVGQRIKVLIYVILIFSSAFTILPFLWMVLTSFKTLAEAFAFPPTWIPKKFMWQNYPEVLIHFDFVRYLGNTVFITVVRISIQIFICSLAAYAFARIRFPGRDVLFIVYLATLMIPIHVILVPNFILMRYFRWIDTYLALIIPPAFGGGAVFGIFMMRQFFLTIPQDLVDASKIDGCSPFGTYTKVILPLSKPALITFAVLTFVWAWNDFLWPVIITSSERVRVLSVGLAVLQGQYWTHIEYVMAAGTLSVIPIIVIYIFAQRFIIEGITLSGMGGV